MKIESVDFFYLSMPEVLDIGDGSQDALLVRVRAGQFEGWGECEASPLTSIASAVCPMSHSACKPVRNSVVGESLSGLEDICRINSLVRENSFDLLQTDHTLSGIDIALWDLMGKRLQEPVYRLLGHERAYPKIAYASQLFGDEPQKTLEAARSVRQAGYRAAKFGWGPYGKGCAQEDADQVHAAREGLGPEGILLIDAGTVWIDNVEDAELRCEALEDCRVLWLEEPFVSGALQAYSSLAGKRPKVRLAGGEGCHNYYMARQMIDHAGVAFIQIDTGRIGGITNAKRVADYAEGKGVAFVNHTFTTHLALSASLQPYAGLETHDLCEYPVQPKRLGAELAKEKLLPDGNGCVHVPDRPGLGIDPNWDIVKEYLVDVEIEVNGKTLYRTPFPD